MKVNDIELTEEEERLFKYLLDTGMLRIEEDEEMFNKSEALMKKLGIFQ